MGRAGCRPWSVRSLIKAVHWRMVLEARSWEQGASEHQAPR